MIYPGARRSGSLPDGTTWRESPWVRAPVELRLAHQRALAILNPTTHISLRSPVSNRVAALAEFFEDWNVHGDSTIPPGSW